MDKKFGFGCMRLPLLDKDDQTSFDIETFNKMVDTFLEKGFTYFDTAYVYHGYRSEEAVRESLVKRHHRDKFKLATKLPMRDFQSVEDMERIFNEQLEKCGVDYFDYYLLHNMGVNAYKKACEFDSFGFGLRKKQEGKIKNFGMSFHDTPELLDEILAAHPELDFVQLQINYIDWENPGIQSRRCYEVARKHGKPIIVMEPCKGGNLALVPEKAEQLMKEYNPAASVPSWAIRFAANQEGVIMVLSGMNTMEQLLDNTSYMADFKPLVKEEYKIIERVMDIINENTAIPCTTCRYCEKDCPKNIAIPDYFALYNSAKRAVTSNLSSQFVYYMNLTANHGKAGDCIGCKQCESACPQHLKITELLKDVSAIFDVTPAFPTKK
ncbi:aldo/keto reductase [Desulfosporosinus sp.]|uniref:aldo/keto reductase n=1 Tax=Desulfosporosinus sp. TaxID=157907 RepID=UPI00230CED77|nr:aldo/keto reductase [Desulfosporosinus sp.]MDA8221635.1 aldo/keto reductase [Desulfitobacterium hafniense]